MLDLKLIRDHTHLVEKKLKTKDCDIDLLSILSIDKELRKAQTKSEELKAIQNKTSRLIGEKKRNNEDVSSLLKEMSTIREQISDLDAKITSLEEKRLKKLQLLPNLPMDDVPVSDDPNDNVCIKTYKEKPSFTFAFKNHLELNEKLKLFDFKASAKISGSNWPLYTNKGAELEWALLNYMIDIHRKNGFMQIMPPLLVHEDVMFGAAQLPKFADQLFYIKDEDFHLYLIPTSEVVLNGLNYDSILSVDELPLKYVSYTPCFRREAGAAGKQERGLIRTHQFNKVELFCVTTEDQSEYIFSEMVKSAEEVLEGLNIHYRNMLLVTKDMSFASAKTVDIEVYLPGQNRYYEVSSVSNCTDFQARRSKIRYKNKTDKKPHLVHTLNGSGVATSRLMVALLENNQQEDGSVVIPEVLRKYLPGNYSKLV